MAFTLWFWECFSACSMFLCYFSSLPVLSSTSNQQTRLVLQPEQMAARIGVVAAMTAAAAAFLHWFPRGAAGRIMPPHEKGWSHAETISWLWKLFCAMVQFVASSSLFVLVCQEPPPTGHGNNRSDANHYIFSLLSLVEHSYTLPLLALCRIVAPQLISFPRFRTSFFDLIMGLGLGPVCTILLFVVPRYSSSSWSNDRSTPMDLSSWESWVLFLLLASVYLTTAMSSSSTLQASRTAKMMTVCCKGLVLCIGIACFYARRLVNSNNEEHGQPHTVVVVYSDYHFFRSFAWSLDPQTQSPAAKYFVQSLLMAWLGLLSCRWFSEVCKLLFFVDPSCCETCLADDKAKKCPRCFCMESMKEDVDDACASIAVAGILMGAYAISGKPLPETNAASMLLLKNSHHTSMLGVFGVLAAVLAGVQLVHTMVKNYAIANSLSWRKFFDDAKKQHEA